MRARLAQNTVMVLAFACSVVFSSTPSFAGNKLLRPADIDSMVFSLMFREHCAQNLPRFRKAASSLNKVSYLSKRSDQQVWDHYHYALAFSLGTRKGKPSCNLTFVMRHFKKDTWAAFAIPAFGETWKSDQTVINKGEGHEGDDFRQHMRVSFPTKELFTFDADKRSDGLWEYKISLIAK